MSNLPLLRSSGGALWKIGGGYTANYGELMNKAPTIIPQFLPDGKVGDPYSVNIASSKSMTKYWFFYPYPGTPPPGMTFTPAYGTSSTYATIGGTPTTAGTYGPYQIGCWNGYDNSTNSSREYYIKIKPSTGTNNASFSLNWQNPGSYPEFQLFVIDPNNFGYSTNGIYDGISPDYWKIKPGSYYRAADPEPTAHASDISPNGGRMNSICRWDGYYVGWQYFSYPRPPQTVTWPSTSPTGVFAFWVQQLGMGYGSTAQYTMSILNGTTTVWSQTNWLSYYASSQIWHFDSATNTVY